MARSVRLTPLRSLYLCGDGLRDDFPRRRKDAKGEKVKMSIPILLTMIALVVLALAGNTNSSTSATGRFVPPLPVVGGTGVPPVKDVAQAATRFSSAYTALTKCGSGMTKKEEQEAEEHGTDIPTRCKGLGGYHVYISYSACSSDISLEKGEESIRLAMQAGNWKQKTVEWRLAQVGAIAKPFAVIFRVYEYGGSDLCATDGKITGESLIVKGLKGYEHIDQTVDVKATPNPNVKARELADKGYAKSKS
jgi:hypothetical protein